MDATNLNGTISLQARLNEPNMAMALNRLLDRVETLEKAVSRLADLLEQAPGMVAMMGDAADETLRRATARGLDVEQRLKTALELAEKLTAPQMVANINQLLAMADQAPGAMAMMGDMVDGTYRRAAERGVDIDQRLRLALELAEKLTDPGRINQLNQLLAIADQAPQMMAMMGDMADNLAVRLNLQARLDAGLPIADKATRPETLQKLGEMFDVLLEAESGMLSPQAVRTLSKTANAMVISQQQPIQPAGLLALLRAMGDPNIQRALGFMLAFGRQFGKEL